MSKVTFLRSLERFKASGIQDSLNYEEINDVLISHHSTAIEGSELTEQETLLLLTEGITAKGKPLLHHNMVTDHHKASLRTIELAREKKELTPDIIKELSSLVMRNSGAVINSMAGTYDSSKGDFRLSAVYVGTRYFTNHQKVPVRVAELCDLINSNIKNVNLPLDIYNLAFDSHFDLVSIHSFADGNGRVSRLLMNYVLEYYKQPLALIYKEDKADYFNALEKAREIGNYQPFRDFMYSQQEKFFSEELKKLSTDDNIPMKRNV